jgi:hypothetical protein
MIDAWLPIGHKLPDGTKFKVALFEGSEWQILETQGGGRALIATDNLAQKWIASGLVADGSLLSFAFGGEQFCLISSGPSHTICPVSDSKSPNSRSEALAFALALKATRLSDKESPLQDAIYVEKISRLLPTYSISSRVDDEIVLGYWLTGGARVSVTSFRRLSQMLSWLGGSQLKSIVEAAGFEVTGGMPNGFNRSLPAQQEGQIDGQASRNLVGNESAGEGLFELPGRPELENFFNEHIIDIVRNRDRYSALGIGFPSAVVLHGPPGCGKTFAVDRLIDFLGWPSFQIDASSVASPYIHETSKKVADIFDKAMQNAPSVLVIDEMEAFLADRDMGSGHHRVEEVAEFLRRIPEAAKNEVLIVAMTNRIDMIDPAILRRGRFDHVIKVDFASEAEVLSLLNKLLSALPKEMDVDPLPFAKQLAGRPLSDVAFVIREGARLAARSNKARLDQGSMWAAMESAPAREREGGSQQRIGFI